MKMITTTKEGRGYIRRRLLFVAVGRGFPRGYQWNAKYYSALDINVKMHIGTILFPARA